jgi:4-amino-4-deoxy-L-arabinose transferase-like glycosyltransferase
MIPRWFERLCVLILLLLAAWLRIWDLPRLPLGFSDDELTSIHIIEQVRTGAVQVFFPTSPAGAEESLYHTLNMMATTLFGDGLFGFRVLGMLASLLALAFLYGATRGLFGPGVALTALAIMVTGIWSILTARTVTPTALAPMFITGTLAALVWTYRLHEPIAPTPPSTTRYTALGFLIGAAIYAHYTGLLLAVILLVFIIYLWWTHQPISRQMWSSSLFTLTLILILALPYLISVLRNPETTSLATLWHERHRGFISGLESIGKTFGGFIVQGDADPTHNVPTLPLLSPFWAILVLVGLVYAMRRWREPAYALLLILLVVGLVPVIWVETARDFPTMLLIQPAFFILAGLGTYYAAQFVQQYGVMGGWRFVAMLTALVFAFTIWQAYQRLLVEWTDREDVQTAYHSEVAQLAAYLDTTAQDTPTVFCVDNIQDIILPDGKIDWSESQMAEYMTHREGLNLRYAVCRSSFVFIGGGAEMRVLLAHPRSLNEAYPSVRVWLEQLEPLDDLPSGVVSRLEVVDELAELGGQLQIGSSLLYPSEGGDPEPVSLPVRFGRNITLMGYQLPDTQTYRPGDVLPITTYWRIDGEPPDHLGIFTRLQASAQASPATETNVFDVTPDNLRQRDVIIETSFMTVPDSLLPGEYILTIGAYDNNPLNQIPVFGEDTSEERGYYLMVESPIQVIAKEQN